MDNLMIDRQVNAELAELCNFPLEPKVNKKTQQHYEVEWETPGIGWLPWCTEDQFCDVRHFDTVEEARQAVIDLGPVEYRVIQARKPYPNDEFNPGPVEYRVVKVIITREEV